jgi:NAD+ synthase
VAFIRHTTRRQLRRKGIVLGLSGGIDSSVCATLAVEALGRDRVLGLMMPEHDSADESLALAELLANELGIEAIVEDVSPLLEGAGCYRRRDEAIRSVVPDYGPHDKSKIVLSNLFDESPYRIHSLVIERPEGEQLRVRLPLEAYQSIVAATNFKQRCRKMLEYYHADRLRYAVLGTPNRLEYDQGFFVKNGDGAADVKPIAHLYKTQVYALARALGLPATICEAEPTTDTYSLAQGQDEFYFGLPVTQMDYALWARNHDVPADGLAAFLGITPVRAARIYHDIDVKRRTTRYLHRGAILAGTVSEVQG